MSVEAVTAVAPVIGGPVSLVLEREVRGWVRRHGIVIWLDGGGHYTTFVDRLRDVRASGALPYRVEAFRGSLFELMAALEPVADGVVRPSLLVHLPDFTEERVRAGPLLELYAAGARYRKALPTLVAEAAAGEVPPPEIAALVAVNGLLLEDADRWLEGRMHAQGSALATRLRHFSPGVLLSALLRDRLLAGEIVGSPGARETLREHLAARLGLGSAWWDAFGGQAGDAHDLAFVAASWALAVEYVHDLRRPPRADLLKPASKLSGQLVETCRGLATLLREQEEGFYERTADETEGLLEEETATARAEDLGQIDTFRFEEEKVLEATFAAVSAADWQVADGYARNRLDSRSFWLERDPGRLAAWKLLEAISCLGLRIREAGGLDPARKPEELMLDYAQRGGSVDRAHRELEQLRADRLQPEVPHFVELRAVLDEARALWRGWADRWARSFSTACRSHGFGVGASSQQRTLFDEIVVPMTREGRDATVLFVVDALRFEMAQALVEALGAPTATTVRLEPRLAELPTITSVGMNVIPSVAAAGWLRPIMEGSRIVGFHTGQFAVVDPKSRQRQMHASVGGSTCPWLTLQEVVSRDTTSLRQALGGSQLLVVHSREIDQAGESDLGSFVFEPVLQKILAAWRLLRDAGARRFVITADHGFLLLDDRAEQVQSHGRPIDPKRRHVISMVGADHDREIRVPLRELGYEGTEAHLMFPETTAVFDTGGRVQRFVHGGNSLQERVVPVLTIIHRNQAGGTNLSYRIEGTPKESLGSFDSVEVTVLASGLQQALDFAGAKQLEVALRVPEDPTVQIELHQVRGASARLQGAVIQAPVGERFELFFRLRGRGDRRVVVELYHPAGRAEVASCLISDRFTVSTAGVATAGDDAPPVGTSWIESLPVGGVRKFFQHLEAHGAVTEAEAVQLLGSAREVRKLAAHVEEHARKAPFTVRIEVLGGVKRYVRGV